jgi:ApaG protein
MFTKTTHSIKVTVLPHYLPEQSAPDEDLYVWSYTVTLENLGQDIVQLINRYWRITDANGHVQEVRGPGVIGEQPVLRPGTMYRYSSGTHLPTPSGIMAGIYQMSREGDGELLDIEVPAFSLDSPTQQSRPN